MLLKYISFVAAGFLAFQAAPPTDQLIATSEVAPPGVANTAGKNDDQSTPDRYVLPARELRIVESDLVIEAVDEILIEGDLLVRISSDPSSETRDSPTITLRAGRLIRISGRIILSDGQSGGSLGANGGRGSSLVIEAPVIIVDGGFLSAGSGGRGEDGGEDEANSRGGTGGDGGSITARGVLLTDSGQPVVLRAGNGGPGGSGGHLGRRIDGGDGGDGGHGGDVLVTDPFAPDRAMPGIDWALGNTVDSGTAFRTSNGIPGASAIAGNGGRGGGGAVVMGALGGSGGNGGDGGDATAGAGGDGADGVDACDIKQNDPVVAVHAGDGGDAGYALAGKGGPGGDGGYGTPAGRGGNGGSGGNAVARDPGDGGRGGDGTAMFPPGHAGRAGEMAMIFAGDGASAGFPSGSGGNGGNARAGAPASDGSRGGFCIEP